MNISFAGPGIDLNRIDSTISNTLTILSTLFATTKKSLLNENVDIFLVKGEVITVLPFLPLVLYCLLDSLWVINPN